MPFTSGTASNALDLHDKLVTFLTTGLGAQNWTVLNDQSGAGGLKRYSFMKAPGLGGTDEIYVTYYSYLDNSDFANAAVRGAAGYLPGGALSDQPGDSGGKALHLWNSNIPYWIVANGRRFIMVAKVSTVYEIAYAGLLIPHGSPSELPYPLFIGACGPASASRRWSDTSVSHAAFWKSYQSAVMRSHAGTWLDVSNLNSSGAIQSVDVATAQVWPLLDGNILPSYSGDYVLTPMSVLSGGASGVGRNDYGELDGIFGVSGFSNASENLISVGGVNHLVVQNVFNTSNAANYAAVRLS